MSATEARSRRSRADISGIEDAMIAALQKDRPMTVRQLFYRMVSEGVIDKTEQEYKGTVCRLLANMRRERRLPFHWLADNTRWVRRPQSHDRLSEMLEESVSLYRRNLWQDQGVHVEIWLEKDALSGVIYNITSKWNVPLMVTRGYPSLTFLHSSAAELESVGKPAFLYYFGDHDPSGTDITRAVEEGVREFAPGADITFERIAVTPEQIEEMKLPTRPTKKSDSRSKTFEGDSVDVDAIPPSDLRAMVERCIIQHIDPDSYSRHVATEQSERQTLTDLLAEWQVDNEDEDEDED